MQARGEKEPGEQHAEGTDHQGSNQMLREPEDAEGEEHDGQGCEGTPSWQAQPRNRRRSRDQGHPAPDRQGRLAGGQHDSDRDGDSECGEQTCQVPVGATGIGQRGHDRARRASDHDVEPQPGQHSARVLLRVGCWA